MSYFIHNIRFEQLETVLRLYKSQSREEVEVLSFFTNKENQQAVKNVYAGKKYNDTYELYKISARELGLDEWRFRQKGIYFVKCTCPSTNHNFYLYVPPEIGEKRDAIAAIAWTIQIDGVPITRQQYINLMYADRAKHETTF